jgi:hypothetical protein
MRSPRNLLNRIITPWTRYDRIHTVAVRLQRFEIQSVAVRARNLRPPGAPLLISSIHDHSHCIDREHPSLRGLVEFSPLRCDEFKGPRSAQSQACDHYGLTVSNFLSADKGRRRPYQLQGIRCDSP